VRECGGWIGSALLDLSGGRSDVGPRVSIGLRFSATSHGLPKLRWRQRALV
jgi:hypothetical protein